MIQRPRPRVIVLLSLAAIAIACRRGEPAGEANTPSARRYTVRGEVLRLPPAGAPGQLVLRHEAIPDFVDSSGAVAGMEAMAMPFDVAPAVRLDGMSVGDKVEAVLAVDWARPSLRIEELRRLPPQTALRLGKTPPEEMPHHRRARRGNEPSR
jgi:Cu/Ag efflux protein CusF